MAMTQQPILVTGAAGFIGYHLCKRLLNAGLRVCGVDNLNAYYSVTLKEARLKNLQNVADFEFHTVGLEDKAALEAIFDTVQPAYVVNLAAQAGVRYSIDNPDAYIQSIE